MHESHAFKAREFTIEFLKSRPGDRFTAREIARAIIEIHPVEAEQKRESSQQTLDQAGLVGQVTAEIGSFRPRLERIHAGFRSSADRPRLYFWSEETSLENQLETVQTSVIPKTEAELYPLLSRYLIDQKNLIPMRIDERRSSQSRGSGGNHWLHPDLVALEDALENANAATVSVGEAYRNELIKLWTATVFSDSGPS